MHSVKMSSDRQIIAPFWEIVVDESTGYVDIVIGSSQLAVCGHVQGRRAASNLQHSLSGEQYVNMSASSASRTRSVPRLAKTCSLLR